MSDSPTTAVFAANLTFVSKHGAFTTLTRSSLATNLLVYETGMLMKASHVKAAANSKASAAVVLLHI